MARIGIMTCSSCTGDSNCASVVCLGDMRKRRGFFARYENDPSLDLIGIISCAGCPTLACPGKILKRVRALASYRIDALHFSYCMTALCPHLNRYRKVIAATYPQLELVLGTHVPHDMDAFRADLRAILCPRPEICPDMNDIISGSFKRKGLEGGQP